MTQLSLFDIPISKPQKLTSGCYITAHVSYGESYCTHACINNNTCSNCPRERAYKLLRAKYEYAGCSYIDAIKLAKEEINRVALATA